MICPVCLGTGAFEPKKNDPETKQKIGHLLGHGLSYQQVATALGLHKSTVGYYAKRYKLKQPRLDLLTNPKTIDALAESGRI